VRLVVMGLMSALIPFAIVTLGYRFGAIGEASYRRYFGPIGFVPMICIPLSFATAVCARPSPPAPKTATVHQADADGPQAAARSAAPHRAEIVVDERERIRQPGVVRDRHGSGVIVRARISSGGSSMPWDRTSDSSLRTISASDTATLRCPLPAASSFPRRSLKRAAEDGLCRVTERP
jgi:hypothetical protein